MTDAERKLFDRNFVRLRRERAAGRWADHRFLKEEAAIRLMDCLEDTKRDFPLALDLGCHQGEVARKLAVHPRVGRVVAADLAFGMARMSGVPACVADEEALPFADNRFDLVTSALSLQHVNDVPGALVQIRRILKPDGLFLAILPGAASLKELREAVTRASSDGGFPLSPRVSPMVEIRDAGSLLQRAGFALPVIDSDQVDVEYASALGLMRDLAGMGESNPLVQRARKFLTRAQLAAMAACYKQAGDGVRMTIEFITLSGWKPAASQPKALPRGSGQMPLGQIL